MQQFINFSPREGLIDKHEIVSGFMNKFYKNQEYDTALPMGFVDHVNLVARIHADMYPDFHAPRHFIWVYGPDSKIFGKPFPITREGVEIMGLLAAGVSG